MVHNPGGDWHPGRGDNPSYRVPRMPVMTRIMKHLQVGNPELNLLLPMLLGGV